MIIRSLIFCVVAVLLAGCTSSREASRHPDDVFGHRFEAPPDGRAVVNLSPADAAEKYFYYPAHIDSLHIRSKAFDPDFPVDTQHVAVEVLLKGVFPDECFELGGLRQHRYGHIVEVDLTMRKPEDAVCRRVRRSYRFYFALDGTYREGSYTIKLNGRVYPFEIRHESS